ncbi:hypothetical protein [Mucilaginibacter sp. SG564]|uniref:hypothetical protein n=1 Tax=unclassified Mucilaginibacter TaxID=2617802 RepID=UPI001552734A|nr:hypothetical protein [Mucilaginibacter sp. SG564]NOW95689.1 hypothetical protein [Mucilaginibacter sp. SG564]
MKRALICFTLISIALLSCKKDHHTQTTEPTGKLYPVSFNISSFSQVNVPDNQNSKIKINAVDPSATSIVKLVYKLFDSNNVLKKTVFIKKGAPNFGTFTDSIPAGSYKAVFLGLKDSANYIGTYAGDPTRFSYYYATGIAFPETFYSNASFTVGNAPVQQSIVLQRLNSEVLVIIKDAIPPKTASITIDITGNFVCSYLDGKSSGSISAGIATVAITSSNIGTTNFQLGPRSVFNNTTPVTVSITAKAADGTIMVQKTIGNVTLQPNTRTILTGNVFTNSAGTGGLAVTFNPDYNTTDINQSF